MDLTTVHEPERSRYVLRDGEEEVGELTYRRRPGEIILDHTGIDPSRQGQGLAGRLVGDALADLESSASERIVPACSYVARYVREHPETRALTER